MTLVSLESLVFFVIMLFIFYMVSGGKQWMVLLGASILYYMLSVPFYTFSYLLIGLLTVYFAAGWIERQRKGYKAVYCAAIVVNVGILVILKYLDFVLGNVESIIGMFGIKIDIPGMQLVASLGVSFYTLQMIGYLTDVYWGISKCQNNIAKLALFNCYFPQMISGPISRYGQISDDLFAVHKFDADKVSKGFFRILLGVFKKVVLAEQLVLPTEALLNASGEYKGVFLWLGMALYVIRIYADFAGCMDIVLGASECFGIVLPENFRNPFGSKSIQEFWQRWHITLGTWLKDYIMYPILRTNAFSKSTKFLKKKVGKQAAKRVPTFLAMFVLWVCMGIWHGGGWNFIAEGVWFWLVIVVGQLLQKQLEKITRFLRINTEGILWSCWQKARTAVVFAIGILFFRSQSVGTAFTILKDALDIRQIVLSVKQVPHVVVALDDTMGTVKFAWTVGSILLGILGIVILSGIEKSGKKVSDFWYGKNIWMRYAIIYILVFSIIIFGAYGPGYSSTEFIYGGF